MSDPEAPPLKMDPEYAFFAAATTARLLSARPVHLMESSAGVGPVADLSEYQHFPGLLQSDLELLLVGAFAIADRYGIEIDVGEAARAARAARRGG